MKYEDIQKQRVRYKQDPAVIRMEYERNLAVKQGDFKKAFAIQQGLENIWFNMIREEEKEVLP